LRSTQTTIRMLRIPTRAWLHVLALTPGLAAAHPLGAQVVRGVVTDTTGTGVAGVDVVLESTDRRARTDSAGRYLLQARSGSFTVLYRSLGYHPSRETVRLNDRDTLVRNVTLIVANAQQLEAVTVKGRQPRGTGLEGFEERRRLGLGSFLDSTVLRRSEGRRVGDVVRELRGIRILERGRNQFAMSGSRGCLASVWLDRQMLYRAGTSDPPFNLATDIQVMSLEAVEWYARSTQVPMEFSRYSDCGVLVLWTRRR
jgi:hypothetical protein